MQTNFNRSMKRIVYLLLFTFFYLHSAAQTAYETQRKKVNNLLENRSLKFGRYDESLTMRTGIFGLKTKKDMQRSNDILTEIVQTDNEIFKELKILLDYKDLEKSRVEAVASETETRMNAYMQTIKKLQDQNDKLRAELDETESKNTRFANSLIVIILFMIISLGILFGTKKLTFK